MTVAFTAFLTAILAAGVFAAAAYLGTELSRIVASKAVWPTNDQAGAKPPIPLLILGSALLGAAIAVRGMEWEGMAVAAIICTALIACWHSAVAYRRIPNFFVLVPLGAIVLSAIVQQNWPVLVSVLLSFLPFAGMAYLSKGKRMGWDDAKLAAFGGAILGLQLSLLAYASACLIGALTAWIRKRTTEPIILAPYMIAAIGICLVWSFNPN